MEYPSHISIYTWLGFQVLFEQYSSVLRTKVRALLLCCFVLIRKFFQRKIIGRVKILAKHENLFTHLLHYKFPLQVSIVGKKKAYTKETNKNVYNKQKYKNCATHLFTCLFTLSLGNSL